MKEFFESFGFSGDLQAIALVASAVISVCLIILLIASVTNRARKRREQRISRVSARAAKGASPTAVANLRRTQSTNLMDRLATRFIPRPQNLRLRLERTGISIGIGHYVLIMIVIAVGEIFLTYHLVGLPVMVAVLLGIASGVAIPHIFISALMGRRQARFTKEFPEGIDVIVRGLRAGLPALCHVCAPVPRKQ